MDNTIIRVIEENVDGCGSNVEMYIRFNKPLTPDGITFFEQMLHLVKTELTNNDACCYTSEEMLNEAFRRFNATAYLKTRGITGEIISEPFAATLLF